MMKLKWGNRPFSRFWILRFVLHPHHCRTRGIFRCCGHNRKVATKVLDSNAIWLRADKIWPCVVLSSVPFRKQPWKQWQLWAQPRFFVPLFARRSTISYSYFPISKWTFILHIRLKVQNKQSPIGVFEWKGNTTEQIRLNVVFFCLSKSFKESWLKNH